MAAHREVVATAYPEQDGGVIFEFRTESVCRVCGQEIKGPLSRTKPRETHEGCGRFDRYLRAAENELDRMTVSNPKRALLLRRRFFAAANSLPVQWQRPRDARGRFSR